MAPFPDDLPPIGMDVVLKLLLYFSILYIIATAVTAKLITRKRVKKVDKIKTKEKQEELPVIVTEPDVFDFEDTTDRMAGIQVKMAIADAAINELSRLKNSDQISDDAYLVLSSKFSEDLRIYSSEIEDMAITEDEPEPIDEIPIDPPVAPMEEVVSEIQSGLGDELIDLGLEDDDDEFLKPKSSSISDSGAPSGPKPIAPQPAAPKTFTAPKPTTSQQFTAPQPAAPKTFTAPKPTTSQQFTAPKPSAPQPSAPKPMAPKPAAPQQFTASQPSAPKPMAPKPAAPQQFTAPKPSAPQPSTPKPTAPQAAQPQGEEGDEKMFAKSTSIAAIRMDMLRELARLKKLINEDE
ncbi:MAG: hypothetical protein INQ03_06960 [Candidatus Heimdallarchaeota archaeon]|nr:hypothetical protein [Candidatus Heimdallarchaeota archaeon]